MSQNADKLLDDEKVTTYTKDTNVVDPSLIAVWRSLREIWNHRWLIWVTFKKEFVGQYKASALWAVWSLVMPLIPLTAYLFLVFIRALNVKGGVPYPVYILSGMTFWLILSEGVTSSMSAIDKERAVLTKVNIPLIAVMMSGYGKVCANTLIRLPFLILVLFIYKIVPPPIAFLFPIVLLPLIFLGLGFGIIFGMFAAMIQDAQNAVGVLLRYGMFLCSVVFPMPTTGWLGVINRVNFFNHLIVGVRDFLLTGSFTDPVGYIAGSAISVLIFVIALKWNHSLQYLVREAL